MCTTNPEVQRLSAQSERIESLPAGMASAAMHGFAWDSVGCFAQRDEGGELFTFSAMPWACATTRSSQIADRQAAARAAPAGLEAPPGGPPVAAAAAPAAAAAAPPTSAAEAFDQLRIATSKADAIHSQAAAERVQEAREKHSRAAPVVQLRPQPQPFTTHPMPSNLPAANLPDPVARARAGRIAMPEAPPADLEQELAAAEPVSDAGGSLTLQSIMGLGTGVLEGLLSKGHQLCVRMPGGQNYALPLGLLSVQLPLADIAELHGQQMQVGKAQQAVEGLLQLPAPVEEPIRSERGEGMQAAPAAPEAFSALTAAEACPVAVEACPAAVSSCPVGAGSEEAVEAKEVLSAEAIKQLQQVEEWYASMAYDEEEGAELETNRPAHLDCYNLVGGVVVASSERVPAVYSFAQGPEPAGITFRASPDGPTLKVERAILDTGANVVLGSKAWVEKNKLRWQPTNKLSMRTSSGDTFQACGRLSKPLIVVFCGGTAEELKVAVDCYVMEDQADLYELLVGTPLVNAVGGDISSYRSSFTYRPELYKEGGDPDVTHSIPICTYTAVAGAAYKESAHFMLGAMAAWAGQRSG